MAEDGPTPEEVEQLIKEMRERGERITKNLTRTFKEAEAHLNEKFTGDPRKES